MQNSNKSVLKNEAVPYFSRGSKKFRCGITSARRSPTEKKFKICFAHTTICKCIPQKEGCHRDSPPISLTFNKSYTMKKHSANAVIQQ